MEAAEAGARTGAGVGARVSRTTLRIRCKSSLKYLRTLVAAAGDFGPKSLASYLENSDFGGEKKSRGATGRHFRRGQLRSRTEVILALMFF